MKQLSLFALLTLIISLLMACNVLREQEITDVVFPPAAVMSSTSPGSTPIASPTQIATKPSEPATTAITALLDPEPATAIPSPEPTLTGSPESRDIPPVTGTKASIVVPATPTSTPVQDPLITFFQADVGEADPGETITLSWGTNNALTVTLWHLAATGQFSQFWPVSASGTFEYDIATHERNRTTFALSAQDAFGNNKMATIEVTLRCPDEWFFASHPDICPVKASLVSAGAEEHFEGGIMLWIAAEDRIYVLFNDGQPGAWQAYSDNWTPGDEDRDPGLAPPATYFQPVRGFGRVWREEPGVRERLGWAISEEVAFEVVVQRTSYAKYNETYILAQDGAIWRLMAERSGWEKLPAGDLN